MSVFLPEPRLLDSPRGRVLPSATAAAAHRVGTVPARTGVAVVGAGPAGLAVASALWHAGLDAVVLDAGARPCERFLQRVDALHQAVLRSPYEHHPGAEGHRDCELLDFARLHWGSLTTTEREQVRMAQSGHRSVVPLDLFRAFCAHVAAVHDVPSRTWRTTVRALVPRSDGVAVHTDDGVLDARHVVLCTGEERRPAPAGWWQDRPGTVGYWDEPVPAAARSLVVVGAGLSAAHVIADALAGGRTVEWVVREGAERYQCADVNASFFRAEGRARFTGTKWAHRLDLMGRHRRASVMFEFRPLLRAAEADGRLTVHRGVTVAGVDGRGVRLAGGGTVGGEHVVLCLGTVASIGHGLLPEDVVGAVDGWPELDDRTLAYARAPRVHAVGAAAAMALGPAARNIDGHRVAAARVVAALTTGAAVAVAVAGV